MSGDDLAVTLAIYMDETFGDSRDERLSYLDRIDDALQALIRQEEERA